MKKIWIISLILAALLAISSVAQAAQTRDAVRAAYRAINDWSDASPYIEMPSVSAPYSPGALTDAALTDALNYLNFLRALAGLEPVQINPLYNLQSQHGAVLLAALDYVDHYAPAPADMPEDFYACAHIGTASGNIAKLNWMRPSILREGLAYFVRDDGEANLPVLGHRRWLLNPLMAETGLGLANSETGMSYVAMYAHDFGNPDVQWSTVFWPSEGAFPADLMHDHLAWSISLNPEVYNLTRSQINITLTEPTLGLHFSFRPFESSPDGFCTLNADGYGAGPCLIFRPDFADTAFTDYQQNQHWTVCIDGLSLMSGEEVSLCYTVDMISLHVQEAVNVELSQLEATLHPDEFLTLSAQVIPSYADDLSITWSSSDETIATVDKTGIVTAHAPGKCEIIASSHNGRSDFCALEVIA